MVVQIRPGLITVWRGAGRWQVGLGEDAVVIDGLCGAEELLLEELHAPCEERGLRDRARALGVEPWRLDALLGALARAQALLPSGRSTRRAGGAASAAVLGLAHPHTDGWSVLASRAGAVVALDSASLTGLALARTLASGGVGVVLVDDDAPVTTADLVPGFCGGFTAADIGRSRGHAARHLLARDFPQLRTHAVPAERPDVAVLLATGALDPARADPLVREGVVHLAVLWHGASTSIGPLVRPGTSTCLRCVAEHRTDRDPEWPRLLSQLAGRPAGTSAQPEEPSLAALAGSLAAAQVLSELDLRASSGTAAPTTLDAVLEVTLATGSVSQRPWTPHPRCGCTWSGRGWGV